MKRSYFIPVLLCLASLLAACDADAPPNSTLIPASTPAPIVTVAPSALPTSTATSIRAPTVVASVTRAPTAPVALSSASARLLFVGDVMLGRGITKVRQQNGNGYPLALVAPIIRSADLAFANLESPLTNVTSFRGGYNLRAEPAAAESLSLAGFDWVSVANNHSGDHGRGGTVDTLHALRAQNIAWAGGGETEDAARRPAVKTVNGLRIALLAYDGLHASIAAVGNQAGAQWLAVERATADIKSARANGTDIVIVSIHWGVEYADVESATQKQIAHQLVLAGADLIIGHHPHVVEPLEWIARADGRTSVVAYSLGNFVFDQWFSDAVMEGVIVQVMVDKQGVAALNLIPTRNVAGQTRVQSAAERAGELRRLLPAGALPAAWQRNATTDSTGRTWWHRPSP